MVGHHDRRPAVRYFEPCIYQGILKRASCGLRLTKGGMLHLKRPYFGLRLLEQGILHLRRPSFGLWLVERALLHLKRASSGLWPIERGILLLFKGHGTRNITRLKNEENNI